MDSFNKPNNFKIILIILSFNSTDVLSQDAINIVSDCQLNPNSGVADIHVGIIHPIRKKKLLVNINCPKVKKNMACFGFYMKPNFLYNKSIKDSDFKHFRLLRIVGFKNNLIIAGDKNIFKLNLENKKFSWQIGKYKSISSCKKNYVIK